MNNDKDLAEILEKREFNQVNFGNQFYEEEDTLQLWLEKYVKSEFTNIIFTKTVKYKKKEDKTK